MGYGRHRDSNAGPDGVYLGFPYRWDNGVLYARKKKWPCKMKEIRRIIQRKVCVRYRGFLMAYGHVQYLGSVKHTAGFRAERSLIDRYWSGLGGFTLGGSGFEWATKPGWLVVQEAWMAGRKSCLVSNQIGMEELDWTEYVTTNDNGKDMMIW